MAGLLLTLRFVRDLFTVLFFVVFGRLFPRKYVRPVDLSGKTAIVTGANSGIGYEITLSLARQKANVYLACRSESKARDAIAQILALVPSAKSRLHFISLDASLLSSARSFAASWPVDTKIDLLIHNAGIATLPDSTPAITKEGLPTVYVTNVLNSFLLTHLLEPKLSPSARVIFTSSAVSYGAKFSTNFSPFAVHDKIEQGFHSPDAVPSAAYGNSKAMQNILANLLQRKWDSDQGFTTTTSSSSSSPQSPRRVAHAFHPGFIATPIFSTDKFSPVSRTADLPFWFLQKTTNTLSETAKAGASCGVYLATSSDAGVLKGGAFWDRGNRRLCGADLMSDDYLWRFWKRFEADAGIEWRAS